MLCASQLAQGGLRLGFRVQGLGYPKLQKPQIFMFVAQFRVRFSKLEILSTARKAPHPETPRSLKRLESFRPNLRLTFPNSPVFLYHKGLQGFAVGLIRNL